MWAGKEPAPLKWVFPHMYKSTACGSGLHIWCQEQNKCSNTVFRRMTPFPEQALLPALCPHPANLWQLHVWPSPLEGTRGRENRKEGFALSFCLGLQGVHITGRWTGEGNKGEGSCAAGSDLGFTGPVSFIRQAHRFFTVDRISHQQKMKPQQLQEF